MGRSNCAGVHQSSGWIANLGIKLRARVSVTSLRRSDQWPHNEGAWQQPLQHLSSESDTATKTTATSPLASLLICSSDCSLAVRTWAAKCASQVPHRISGRKMYFCFFWRVPRCCPSLTTTLVVLWLSHDVHCINITAVYSEILYISE